MRPATLEGGHPNNRHPRFRLAVHAAHCPPHSRTERLLRRAALHGAPRRNSGAPAARPHPLRRPVVGLRCRRAGRRPRSCSSSACPCSASATACTSSCITWAARCAPRPEREYGHAEVTIENGASQLFAGLPANAPGLDEPRRRGRSSCPPASIAPPSRPTRWPASPTTSAASGPCSSIPRCTTRRSARRLIKNFVFDICGARGDWTPAHFIETTVASIREKVGKGHVICGLSGGVDSSVAAVLVHKAIGDQLTCIFVNNGVLRKNEFAKRAEESARQARPQHRRRRCQRALPRASWPASPILRRSERCIGAEFIAVFDDEATRIAKETGGVDWLVQGTLYPDVIESSQRQRPQPDHQEPPQRRRPARSA